MKKKLIEVALPLEAINIAAANEKYVRQGHPSTLHLWWARRPLAACRAILFASLVDDPSGHPEEFPTETDQDRERQRLFRLIEELVKWENSTNTHLLQAAHREILKSTDGNPPPVYDPFCGGGSIPLEAQRFGLEAHASDLNPVAVLITKALIEIPSKFVGQPPIHPMPQGKMTGVGMWVGARGLADDVRYYGQWMRDQAFERVGHLYPKVTVPDGGEATVIAWLWARTVKCPNPACGARMPLVKSFLLSSKQSKRVWVVPETDPAEKVVRFEVHTGNGTPQDGTVNRRGAKCIVCGSSVSFEHIRAEGQSHQIMSQLLAVVGEGHGGRIYCSPSDEQIKIAESARPRWTPDTSLPSEALGFRIQRYGMSAHRDMFTNRQLEALSILSELIPEVTAKIQRDGGSREHSEFVATYLALALDRLAMTGNSLVRWNGVGEKAQHAFGRQAISMLWDYAEPNLFGSATGSISAAIELVADPIDSLPCIPAGRVEQLDAMSDGQTSGGPFLICTDPPYYDNVGYADLSDFFYVWLRRCCSTFFPDLFSTLLVPKAQELVANPFRFEGSRSEAQKFFELGFGKAFKRMRSLQHAEFPLTVFYAFKQAESEDGDQDDEGFESSVSTGWETMLEGLIRANFQISGTWPMRTEMRTRMRSMSSNALASSIVLVCRPQSESASITTRKDFLSSLKNDLPIALRDLQKGNIAPVDLAQAAIGPGMAVFSRYKKVLETDGSPMRVRTALALINQALDEVLSEQEGEFDADTRWALAWFGQHAFDEGLYGEAEVLATAKALSVSALDETKILQSRAGKVRLLRRDELPGDWNPSAEHRLTVWAVTQHLIRSLDKNGETATATLASKVGGLAEAARDLAYRLYVLCERKGWAEEAGYYNSLVVSWPAIAPKAFALS